MLVDFSTRIENLLKEIRSAFQLGERSREAGPSEQRPKPVPGPSRSEPTSSSTATPAVPPTGAPSAPMQQPEATTPRPGEAVQRPEAVQQPEVARQSEAAQVTPPRPEVTPPRPEPAATPIIPDPTHQEPIPDSLNIDDIPSLHQWSTEDLPESGTPATGSRGPTDPVIRIPPGSVPQSQPRRAGSVQTNLFGGNPGRSGFWVLPPHEAVGG